MATLQLTPKYFNTYEAAHNILSKNSLFRQGEWERWANKGEIDNYITILANTDKIKDRNKFFKDYNLEYGDDELLTAAMYNEIFADRTNVTQERERTSTDETGNPIIEKFTASDYDYRKQLINNKTAINYEKYLTQQEQERKDSMNGFVKFLGTVAAIPGEFIYGFANQIDNIFNSVAAIGNGVGAMFSGESFADAVVKTNASEEGRLFEQLGVQDWIVDFESKYTHMRDLDGNYSTFGKYAGGVASTVGQLMPSMVAGRVSGKAATGLGATATKASSIAKATSSLIFYQGVTAGNVRDIYQEMAKNNVSVPSAGILANATIKSALQWGIEVGLAKILGGSSLDAMVFGRSVSTGASSTLAKSAGKRLLKDFVTEGLEEVFQDTSDFLVDAISTLSNENFCKITNFSWQAIADAFVIGGLASFSGSAAKIIGTKRITTPNVKTDKNGDVELKKLSKLSSWEYGLNMQSFMQNFAILQEQGKGLIKHYDTNKDKEGREYAAAFTEMYAAYRMLSSVYMEIGDERFAAANDILTSVTRMIENGKFDSSTLKNASSEVLANFKSLEKDAIDIAKEKIKKAAITKIKQVIDREDDLSTANIPENTKRELEKLFNGDDNIKKVVLTEDGNNIVITSDTMFVPMNYANNANAETMYETVAEQTLVEKIMQGDYKGLPLQNITSVFREVSGKNDATTEEAVYNLVFNDSFFRVVLSTANKDTFAFVSSLVDIEEKVVPNKLRNVIYKQKIATVIKNMKQSLMEYLSNQVFADYKLDIFTVEEQRKIAATRCCKDLYGRVVNNSSFKKLTEEDWKVLNGRVNSLPVSQSEKDKILKNLHSENSVTRTSAMNRIATAYAGIFTTKYDGKIYMPDTSIPNRTFNMFLQNKGLTIETLIDVNADDSVRNLVISTYGEFTEANLIDFRQKEFMQASNNKYTFRYNKQGKIGIFEADTNKQVGFSVYNAQKESLLIPDKLDNRTIIERGNKKNYLVTELINSEIDDATAAYLSIDNIITDPSLLNEQHQANIQLKYGEVTVETTFLYLRQYFLDKLKTTTVIVLSDGSYAFGNVRPMLSILKSNDLKIDKNTKITQLIKSSFLYGRLANVKIKLVDKDITAEYNSSDNTIYIKDTVAKRGGNLLTFALLHEFQHAMQVENNMNIGINANWIKSTSISKSIKQSIIADVRKHRPEFFKDVSKGSDAEAKIVNDFVYYSSGESTAFGADASSLIDFYPTIVKDIDNSTIVQFPWGNKYNLSNNMPMSLVSQFGKFDIEFTKQEKDKYKQLSQEAYMEISGKTDNKNVLTMFSSQHGAEFISTFLKILSVSDDMTFISNLYDYLDDNLQENYDLELQECYNLTSERIAELRLFARGIQDVDKVTGIKTLTVSELSELFFKYNTDISMEPIAKKVFALMEGISAMFGSNIAVSSWAEEALQFADLDNTLYVSGYCYKNLIRYCANNINVYDRSSVSEIYLHEAIHFVTEPLLYGKTIRNSIPSTGDKFLSDERLLALNCINMLYEKIKPEYKFKPYIHLVENIAEFMSAITDKSFILSIGRKFTENIPASLQTSIFNLTGKNVVSYTDAYYELINYIVSQPASPYAYDAFYNNLDRNAYYQQLIYADTHDSYASLRSDGKGVYRTENGKRIYLGDANFYASTSLGPSDNMSMATSDISGEERVKIFVESKAEELLSNNEKLTEKGLVEKLSKDFPFVPNDIIVDIVKKLMPSKTEKKQKQKKSASKKVTKTDAPKQDNNFETLLKSTEGREKVLNIVNDVAKEYVKLNKKITTQELAEKLKTDFSTIPPELINEVVTNLLGDARVELEQLEKESKGQIDENDVRKPQGKSYQDVIDADEVIKNTSNRGKWIEKRPKLNKQGEIVRNKKGHVIYDYKYASDRYAGQKAFKGTNLEKFGYTKKYKKTTMSPELQAFIVNATEDIDKELCEKVQSGNITTQDVLDYFRDAKTIDDITFKLINDSFFKNSKIKTFEQLKTFTDEKSPKYYAMRAVARKLGYSDMLMSNTNPKLLDNFLQIIEKDVELKKLYDEIYDRYYTYKGHTLLISEKNLRRLWMQYFDGSAQMAGYIATIAKMAAINKWIVTGEGSTKATESIDKQVAEDMSLEEIIDDESASEAFEALFYSNTREQQIEEIMKIAAPKYIQKLLVKGKTQSQAAAAIHKKWEQLREMDDKEFAKQYAKIVRNMSEEEINNIFAKQLIAQSSGLDINKLNEEELKKLDDVASEVTEDVRPSSAVVNNIRSIARTIKSNLSAKDKARFIKENGDIFTDDLKIKDEVVRKKDKTGKERYIDVEELLPIEERVRKLSKDVRAKVYQSKRSMDFKKQMEREVAKLEKKYNKTVEELVKTKGKTQAVTYEISDETITIDTDREIPSALKRILEHEFTNVAKSKTKYIIEGEQSHIQTNLKTFLQDNAELLASLEQSDVDEIIDFYLASEILPSTNKARTYSAIQVYLMTYIIKGNKTGQFILTDEQLEMLNNRLENLVSISAANLSNWKSAMKMLKPAEVIIQSLAKSCDIEFSTGDVENLISAIESGDVQKIAKAKQKMYDNGLRQYNGRKQSFFNKLIKFERMAMLSSPSTWIRNKVSNVLVTAGNKASEKIGGAVSSLIEKMFPKKKWKRDNQYKIVGTKVSTEIQNFIKTNIVDTGLLSLIQDGLNKYDTRKSKSDLTSDDSFTRVLIESIKSKIFQENTFKFKTLNAAQQIILKGLSDEKSIYKAAIRYFGKILAEDNVDLSKGLTTEVLDHLADAYKMASYDYMHKSNFFNKIEVQLKQEWGDAAYFMYKQLFPFASASWNWFVEGLNYTPVGLALAIRNFAKLEKTIDKLDEKMKKGDSTISSRWSEYLARRNIGKGVIGSIGFAIGAMLAGLGFAGIDEKDEKYKLFISIGDEKIYVDISDLFGTQGIMLGISMISAFKEGNWMAAIGDTLDTMFMDSTFSEVFNTFRYSDSFGDWLVNQPFAFLKMFIPNFLKTLSSISYGHKVKYDTGLLGKIEQLAVQAIPGLVYVFPKQVDPYTGETQIAYKMWFVTGLANKLLPFKVHPYNISDAEKAALAVGVKKAPLTGRYNIDGEKLNLTASQIEELNEYYGSLNKKELSDLMSNRKTYRVWDDKKKQYVEIKYSRMTDGQRKTVIERIMDDNGQKAKVYILTSSLGYKYYANESEYAELKKLNIKNVYKSTSKLEGFKTN